MTYIDTATYKPCSICKQNNPEMIKNNFRVSFAHMKKHASLVGTFLHNNFNLSEKTKKKAVDSVLKRIWRYEEKLNHKTIRDALITFLRHEAGSNLEKDRYAQLLGGRRLDELLSKDEYKEFKRNLNKNADIVLRALART